MTYIIHSGDAEVVQHIIRHRVADIIAVNVQRSKHNADPDLRRLVAVMTLLYPASYHYFPVYLPPYLVFFSPGPAKIGVKSRPVLPSRMYVETFELFQVLGIPNARLSCNLLDCQHGAKQPVVHGVARTASTSWIIFLGPLRILRKRST